MTEQLYNDLIVAEAKAARGAGRLVSPSVSSRADNPLCGDRVTLDLTVVDGRIGAAAHATRGCLLTRAAASLLCRQAPGTSLGEAARWRARVAALLHGEPVEGWPELAMFAPVQRVKSRHDCVLLPFKALDDALRKLEAG